jgi:hypothetical protein
MHISSFLVCTVLALASGELSRVSATLPERAFSQARAGRTPKAHARRPRAHSKTARQKTPSKQAPVGQPSAVERDFEREFGTTAKGPATVSTANPG